MPASIDPIITLDAPAASAFTMSPEYLMPPSAITGMSPAPSTASNTAVSCGTPTPVTTRVVQIDPGPTPTFTASTPRSTSARGAFARRDVAGDELHVGKASRAVGRRAQHAFAVPVRGVDDEHVDARIDERARAIHVIRRADRRGDAQAAVLVLVRVRKLAALVDVLDRDQSLAACPSRPRPGASRCDACRVSARLRRASCRPAR